MSVVAVDAVELVRESTTDDVKAQVRALAEQLRSLQTKLDLLESRDPPAREDAPSSSSDRLPAEDQLSTQGLPSSAEEPSPPGQPSALSPPSAPAPPSAQWSSRAAPLVRMPSMPTFINVFAENANRAALDVAEAANKVATQALDTVFGKSSLMLLVNHRHPHDTLTLTCALTRALAGARGYHAIWRQGGPSGECEQPSPAPSRPRLPPGTGESAADKEDIANLYSYCVETSAGRSASVSAASRAAHIVILYVLVTIQVVFA